MTNSFERTRESTIRRARLRSGVGVRQLARRLDVTAAAVTEWERSEERGTAQVNTISRALSALGEQVVVGSKRVLPHDRHPLMDRREERVALELHRAVAKKLVDDPQAVLAIIPQNLERLRGQVHGDSAKGWLDEWAELAELASIGGLVDVMLGTDRRSIDMRQASPFLGVLSQPERLQAVARARQV